jgi:hypothetical protein
MAALIHRLGDLTKEEIERLPGAMAVVIARTIERSIHFPARRHNNGQASYAPPSPYGEFADLIFEMSNRDSGSVSVISFNYDTALDYALYSRRIPHNYCLSNPRRIPGLDYLKLHGSLNWYRCGKCSAIVEWPLEEFFKKFSWPPFADSTSVRLDISNRLDGQIHCGETCRERVA